MKEIWADIDGFGGIYQISDKGRVKRNSYVSVRRDGSVRTLKEGILKGKGIAKSRKHQRVSLWWEGKSVDFYIHRLVAEAFIPKVRGKEFINHIDGDPLNNKVNNLEWCTPSENNLHATRTGLRKHGFKVKLTNRDNGETFIFPTQQEASIFLGRNHGYVGWNIRNKNNPKDINDTEYKAEII